MYVYQRLLLKYLQISGELKWRLVRTLRHLKSRMKYTFCVVLGMAVPDPHNKASTLQTSIIRYPVLISVLRPDMLTEVSKVSHRCSHANSRAVY
jgi:hypothetical protein